VDIPAVEAEGGAVVRTDVPDPAGTWSWWADTWGYLNGPLGIIMLVIIGFLAYIVWLDACDRQEDDRES